MASLPVSAEMLTQVLSLLVLVTRMLYLSVEGYIIFMLNIVHGVYVPVTQNIMAFITALFHKQDYYLHLCKVLTLK